MPKIRRPRRVLTPEEFVTRYRGAGGTAEMRRVARRAAADFEALVSDPRQAEEMQRLKLFGVFWRACRKAGIADYVQQQIAAHAKAELDG